MSYIILIWGNISNSPHVLASSISWSDLLPKTISQLTLPLFHPTSSLKVQNALDRSVQVQTWMEHSDLNSDKTARGKTVHWCASRLEPSILSNFQLQHSQHFVVARKYKVSNREYENDITTQHNRNRWSNELGFGQIRFQRWAASHKADPMVPTNPFFEEPRDSSENMHKAIIGSWRRRKPLPRKSVSDNLLVVQRSMAHLKVWRWLECLYYGLVIELCGLRMGQKRADQSKHSCQMNSFRHAFQMSHKKCNVKFRYSIEYLLHIWKLFSIPRKLFASSFYFKQKNTGHTRHCFHHNPRLVVVFWRSLAFCTSALCRIWRASRLVAHWACGRLWSWKVLNSMMLATQGPAQKRWTNEWSEIGKMK